MLCAANCVRTASRLVCSTLVILTANGQMISLVNYIWIYRAPNPVNKSTAWLFSCSAYRLERAPWRHQIPDGCSSDLCAGEMVRIGNINKIQEKIYREYIWVMITHLAIHFRQRKRTIACKLQQDDGRTLTLGGILLDLFWYVHKNKHDLLNWYFIHFSVAWIQ